MNNKWIFGALGVVALAMATPSAQAQRSSGAENSLIGIKLYDSGLRVVSIYGTPDKIEGVGGGGGAIGPGGGGPAGGGPAAPGGPAAAGGGRAGRPSVGAGWNNELTDLGNGIFQRGGAGVAGEDGPVGMGGGPGTPPGGGPAGGGAAAGTGTGGRVIFTRWIYNRNGSKYGFVLDKSNRVVQIEAIGLTNAKVRTSRGIGFGSTFAQLIKKYSSPDGYEINGDNIVVRFLVRNKVAFRLSRLGPNKPQVVTGIVVAAGKN